MHSSNWGGGVASLVPDKSSTVKGAVVSLDPEQLSRLDVFEKGYSKQELTATIESPGNSRRTEQVIAYIADNPSWVAPPSESYLTAINLMLREHWDADEPIPILGWSGDGVEEKAPAWRHPGTMALGLRALCVEINARLVQAPLVVPRATVEIEKALAQVDIASTAALAAALGAGAATPALRQALAAGGGDEDEMLQVCRDLFGAHLVFVYGSLMSGFDNHHFIAASTRLMDEAATQAHFTLVASENEALEFPYALDEADSRPSDTLCALKGEVYLVDAAGLATLDWLEDHPDLYERRLTPIARLGEAAWVYILASRDSIDCVRALTWQHPQVTPCQVTPGHLSGYPWYPVNSSVMRCSGPT